MKTIFTSILVLSFLSLTAFSQQGNIDAVIGALRSGSAIELSSYFDENVDLTLPDKRDNYSKAQAQQILKDFFTINMVKSFDVKHKGDNGDGPFCIGTLQTKSGSFRTTVFMKTKNNKELVKDIRFQSIE